MGMGMDDHEIQRLMRLLPPPPPRWVQAAKELPFVQDEIAAILARAADDAEFDRALRSDPTLALEQGGYELSHDVVAHVMRRLPQTPGS
jgi:hypothetical protein